jgi:hypothetical protein
MPGGVELPKERGSPLTLQTKYGLFVVHTKLALVSVGHSDSCFRDEVRVTGSIAHVTATLTTKEVGEIPPHKHIPSCLYM